MRAKLRGCQSHGAFYACDYCLARAESVPRKRIFTLKKDSAEPRTHRFLKLMGDEVQDACNAGQVLDPEETKGVVEKSVLQHLPGVNLVDSMPAEPMHLICEGVIKALLK